MQCHWQVRTPMTGGKGSNQCQVSAYLCEAIFDEMSSECNLRLPFLGRPALSCVNDDRTVIIQRLEAGGAEVERVLSRRESSSASVQCPSGVYRDANV